MNINELIIIYLILSSASEGRLRICSIGFSLCIAPPHGLYAPKHDLAILWQSGRTQKGLSLRDLLGWATMPETRAESTQPLPPLPPEAIPTVTVLPTVTASPVPPGQPTPVPGGGA